MSKNLKLSKTMIDCLCWLLLPRTTGLAPFSTSTFGALAARDLTKAGLRHNVTGELAETIPTREMENWTVTTIVRPERRAEVVAAIQAVYPGWTLPQDEPPPALPQVGDRAWVAELNRRGCEGEYLGRDVIIGVDNRAEAYKQAQDRNQSSKVTTFYPVRLAKDGWEPLFPTHIPGSQDKARELQSLSSHREEAPKAQEPAPVEEAEAKLESLKAQLADELAKVHQDRAHCVDVADQVAMGGMVLTLLHTDQVHVLASLVRTQFLIVREMKGESTVVSELAKRWDLASADQILADLSRVAADLAKSLPPVLDPDATPVPDPTTQPYGAPEGKVPDLDWTGDPS